MTTTVFFPYIVGKFPPTGTLRAAADQLEIEIGGHGNPWNVETIPEFKALLEREYNLSMTDCEICWINIRPTASTFDFSGVDRVASQAKNANMIVQAHHLLWGYRPTLPAWLLNGHYT